MSKTSPVQFFQQVRQEVAKVTWPSRKETAVTGAMVIVMVVVMAIFFLVVDMILGNAVTAILGLGA